jgi:hypothetical protein
LHGDAAYSAERSVCGDVLREFVADVDWHGHEILAPSDSVEIFGRIMEMMAAVLTECLPELWDSMWNSDGVEDRFSDTLVCDTRMRDFIGLTIYGLCYLCRSGSVVPAALV